VIYVGIFQELLEKYDISVLPTFVAIKGGDQVGITFYTF